MIDRTRPPRVLEILLSHLNRLTRFLTRRTACPTANHATPRSHLVGAIALALSLGGIPSSASAQDSEEDWTDWVTLTPRLWVSAIDAGDAGFLVRETVIVPMGGLSATISPPVTPGFSLGVTLLGGAGKGDFVFDARANGGDTDFQAEGEGDVTRVDLEILARYQIPDSPISLYFGPRYIHFDEEYEAGGLEVESTENDVALQIGFGAATELAGNGNHRMFGNIMTGVVFVDSETEISGPGGSADANDTDEFPMLDLNGGYQYILNDQFSFNARYRFFIVFNENDYDFDSTFLVHGPEFGATIRF